MIGALSALVRPVLLALVAPFSLWLMLAISLVFQVLVILALVPLVPGFHVANLADATFAAVAFAVLTALISWLLSLDSDDSYYSMLMRRLLSYRDDVIRTKNPGLIVVQIDGLSHEVLTQQINAGRVPGHLALGQPRPDATGAVGDAAAVADVGQPGRDHVR